MANQTEKTPQTPLQKRIEYYLTKGRGYFDPFSLPEHLRKTRENQTSLDLQIYLLGMEIARRSAGSDTEEKKLLSDLGNYFRARINLKGSLLKSKLRKEIPHLYSGDANKVTELVDKITEMNEKDILDLGGQR
jgi:hypothetical protein